MGYITKFDLQRYKEKRELQNLLYFFITICFFYSKSLAKLSYLLST